MCRKGCYRLLKLIYQQPRNLANEETLHFHLSSMVKDLQHTQSKLSMVYETYNCNATYTPSNFFCFAALWPILTQAIKTYYRLVFEQTTATDKTWTMCSCQMVSFLFAAISVPKDSSPCIHQITIIHLHWHTLHAIPFGNQNIPRIKNLYYSLVIEDLIQIAIVHQNSLWAL